MTDTTYQNEDKKQWLAEVITTPNPAVVNIENGVGAPINRTLQVVVIISVLMFSLILILSAFGYTAKM